MDIKQELLALGHRVTKKDGRRLFLAFCDFSCKFCRHYDAEFMTLYDQTYPIIPVSQKKRDLLALGHRVTTKDPAYQEMLRYACPHSNCYDPRFRKKYETLYPSKRKLRS